MIAGMAWLVGGLILFLGVHTLGTLRGTRAALIGRLGEGPYKGLYSLVSLAGLVLIVVGFGAYRSAGYVQVWNPPFAIFHPIALFLLWFAFVALVSAYSPPSRIKSLLRHPMLVAVKAWALSHLLVNGDLGSMILFGGLLIWAVYDRISLKRRGDAGAAQVGWSKNDALVLLLGTAAYVLMFWLHDSLIGVAAA